MGARDFLTVLTVVACLGLWLSQKSTSVSELEKASSIAVSIFDIMVPEVQEAQPLTGDSWLKRYEVYPEREKFAPRQPSVGVAGIKLGTGRRKVESLLNGRLAPRIGLTHSGQAFYVLCQTCGAGTEMTNPEGCVIHGHSRILTLSFDSFGYVEGISGLPLQVGDVELGAGNSVSEVERLLQLKNKDESHEGVNIYDLSEEVEVILFLDDGKMTSARVSYQL